MATVSDNQADSSFSADFLRQVIRHQKTKVKKKKVDGYKKKERQGRIVGTDDRGPVNLSCDTISTLQSEGIPVKDEAIDVHSVVSLHVAKRRLASRINRGKKRCNKTEIFSKRKQFTDIKESLINFFKAFEESYSSTTEGSKKTPRGGTASPDDEKTLIAKFFKSYLNMDLMPQKTMGPQIGETKSKSDLDAVGLVSRVVSDTET